MRRQIAVCPIVDEHVCLSWHRVERLVLLARDLARIGTAPALQLQMLTNGVVEQTHAPRNHTRLDAGVSRLFSAATLPLFARARARLGL